MVDFGSSVEGDLDSRNGARLHVARKTKAPDNWDPPYESYDPYRLGGVAGDEFIDD